MHVYHSEENHKTNRLAVQPKLSDMFTVMYCTTILDIDAILHMKGIRKKQTLLV